MAWICKKKWVIASSLVLAVSLFLLLVNYSEKPYFRLQPMLGQSFGPRWMSSWQHKAARPHPGYVSVPKKEPLKLSCNVCSVVSSSGQVLGRGAGAEIDRASCVWRMNNAPTQRYEKDVGNRTNLRMVSHTSVPLLLHKPQHFFGPASNGTVYVVWGPRRNMSPDGSGVIYNMLRHVAADFPNARIYVTTDERMDYCDDVFKNETGRDRITSGSYLSTGWFTLILAMDMCKEIHVYGMINNTYCKSEGYRKVPYHYYEAGSRDECAEYVLHENAPYGGHRFITEKAVFAKWAKTHPMKFFHPEWQLS
ncbi:alpha-N-acetylgalactosaminide alpha-2,6-sialyltransferase 3 isoform X1 [Ictalurus punctatus]|uniref:alpha-N-acetylneuraminyl-2,3-beta-galactosyl-1,3-N-acetylgalactosaminide6-alpha-sialyltransferase n=1 Tax=Ictalurus punctatus TaxID=7998 RepID=W5UKH6_ICTPU|nr:alpha-N-acetylgalactosaminide alpha-2,6-sialyltransferase 3 isoform X1 [Ictalurus punctatus]